MYFRTSCILKRTHWFGQGGYLGPCWEISCQSGEDNVCVSAVIDCKCEDHVTYQANHVCPQYENWPHGREIIEMCRPHYGKPEPKGGCISSISS